MSKWKSQIGTLPSTRQQPPPMLPDRSRWSTEPPVADQKPGVADWLRIPTPRSPPEPGEERRIIKLQRDLNGQLRASRGKDERRGLRAQLEHVDRWLAVAASIKAATKPDPEPEPTLTIVQAARRPSLTPAPEQSPEEPQPRRAVALSPERKAALDELRRRASQLMVRIDAIAAAQKGRGRALADPATYNNVQLRSRLLVDFERDEATLAELQDRHEFVTARIEHHREQGGGRPQPRLVTPPPSAAVIRGCFGRRVRELRTRSKLTQAAIGERAGIPAHLVASIEIGDGAAITIDALAAISRALGISLSELFIGIDVERSTPATRISSAIAAQPIEIQESILEIVELALACEVSSCRSGAGR